MRGKGLPVPKKTVRRSDGQTAKASGPKAKRAAKPKAAKSAGGALLRVKQVRSGIGHAETYRRTLVSLGIRHHQMEVTVSDNPTTRGMLTKVHHLVSVRPVEA